MINKQEESAIETASQPYNALQLYNTTGSLSQYIVYNLFRILRPIRKKFSLTINEIVILNGMMLYNKYIGSSFSYSAILRFVGYFNTRRWGITLAVYRRKDALGYLIYSTGQKDTGWLRRGLKPFVIWKKVIISLYMIFWIVTIFLFFKVYLDSSRLSDSILTLCSK